MAQVPTAITRRGSAMASKQRRNGSCMARPTGPVTTSASAKRGEATKWTPKRATSKTGFVVAETSWSGAWQAVETWGRWRERRKGEGGGAREGARERAREGRFVR